MANTPQPPRHTPPPAASQSRMPVPGIPPRPDVTEQSGPLVDEQTAAEQEAGRKASAAAEDRLSAEQEAGRRIVAGNAARARQQAAGQPALPPPGAPPMDPPRRNPLHGG